MSELDCSQLEGRPRRICEGTDEKVLPLAREALIKKWIRQGKIKGELPTIEKSRRKKTPVKLGVAPREVPQSGGVGTELKQLLASKGIQSTSSCQCNARAADMDREGIKWCESNRDTIIGWLMEGASHRIWLKPYLVLFPGDARRRAGELLDEAITKAKHQPLLRWQYGLTTVPERSDTMLKTLKSLEQAGFPTPWVFVDGAIDATPWRKLVGSTRLVTTRAIRAGVVGNWILSLWELYLHDAFADRYAIFQDDMIACRNLRSYLERCEYPAKGYLNLFTFMDNEPLTKDAKPGAWQESSQVRNNPNQRQTGQGALALVFSNEAARTLLASQSLVNKPQAPTPPRRKYCLDGGVVAAMNRAGFREYIHNPSLVQHTGKKSTIGNEWPGAKGVAMTFPGEDFDAMGLL